MQLDLYLPRGARTAPLAVYIHGGAWVSGDKRDYAGLGAAFARRGIAAAVLNYRLAPAVDVRQQLDDVVAALHWLAERAQSLGYDARRIFLVGHSAGAQLAVYALASGKIARTSIAGIVAIGSVGINPSSDVAELDQRYRDIYEPAFGSDRAAWSAFDVQPLLRGDEPPVLVIHGAGDFMAPEAISRQLYQQLDAAGCQADYIQPANCDHWNMLEHMAEPGDPTMHAVARFVLGK